MQTIRLASDIMGPDGQFATQDDFDFINMTLLIKVYFSLHVVVYKTFICIYIEG